MDSLQSELPNVQDLLRYGRPFVPFSEFSIGDLAHTDDTESWVQSKLLEGQPFVIRGFRELESWDKEVLNNKSFVALSPSGVIPVRNCQSGRDVKMRLRELLSHVDNDGGSKIREQLYAKDLNCPNAWVKALDAVLPPCLRHLGSFDLFRVLPKDIASEVLMAYVGTRKSFSGFHRCFSGTVSLNLLIECEESESGSICFGTDQGSQGKYDIFMEELGKSPHTDWTNISISQLRSADFPIYVTHQEPGDLVVFPSATSHQIWNASPVITKAVWNILHTSSLASFLDYVQPVYQNQCHSDTGRVPLIPFHALKEKFYTKSELPLLLQIFKRLISDEEMEIDSALPIKLVDTQGAVVECNFCGLTIWNRHMHCEKCGDFDLCLTCFISGRSCKHIGDYTCAQIVSKERCLEIINDAHADLEQTQNFQAPRQRSLGTLAIAAVESRSQPTERLCHLCRDSHPIWKGTTCPKCSAFFCFRGLHRHFDIELIPFLRSLDPWSCPKCSQICNCRCCHFYRPHKSRDKPIKARIKPVDSRGRILGFVDNVFDQKRGKRASMATQTASPQPITLLRGQKRPRAESQGDDYIGHEETSSDIQHHGPANAAIGTNVTSTTRSETPGGYTTDTNDRGHRYQNLSPADSLRNTGQLRISDLVDDSMQTPGSGQSSRHSIRYRSTPSSLPRNFSHRQENFGNEDTSTITAVESYSIPALENKLNALRRYAEDLLELSLVDSHAKLLEKITQLESQIDQRRRQKAELLFSNLNRDFPDLANVAMEEARRRGL